MSGEGSGVAAQLGFDARRRRAAAFDSRAADPRRSRYPRSVGMRPAEVWGCWT